MAKNGEKYANQVYIGLYYLKRIGGWMDGQDWYYIGIVMWLWPCPMEQNKNILILMTDLFSVYS